MNISLTLNFDTMSELEAYLASRSNVKAVAAAPATLAAVAPAPVAVPVAPTPAPVAPTPAPVATLVPAPAVDDTAAVKTRIMNRLKEIAGALPDKTELGKFITAFGVARFSELPDAQLGQFEALMNQTYPA